MSSKIITKTSEQIAYIREAGKYWLELMTELRDRSRAWVTLMELENHADDYMRKHNIRWSFKWYQWFPANLCLSVNECVVHGIPDNYVLKNGDLLKIDMGITYQHCIADAAISIVIGGDHTNPEAANLVTTTKNALDAWLETMLVGQTLEAYGQTVYDTMQSSGYEVIRHLTGHGVGVLVHEWPSVYNRPHRNLRRTMLRPGMVLALEPITSITSQEYIMDPVNERNLYTEHGDLGAQREYTIAITDNGPEVLAGMKEL